MERGQVAVTVYNFQDIIEALTSPDTVESSEGRNNKGVVFKKTIGGKITAITVVKEL